MKNAFMKTHDSYETDYFSRSTWASEEWDFSKRGDQIIILRPVNKRKQRVYEWLIIPTSSQWIDLLNDMTGFKDVSLYIDAIYNFLLLSGITPLCVGLFLSANAISMQNGKCFCSILMWSTNSASKGDPIDSRNFCFCSIERIISTRKIFISVFIVVHRSKETLPLQIINS